MYLNVHCRAIYNSWDMEAAKMSINRGMDKEAMVHIYNGILLSYKKECICVSPYEVDKPRTYYTE